VLGDISNKQHNREHGGNSGGIVSGKKPGLGKGLGHSKKRSAKKKTKTPLKSKVVVSLTPKTTKPLRIEEVPVGGTAVEKKVVVSHGRLHRCCCLHDDAGH
jgi:hypothetical protein